MYCHLFLLCLTVLTLQAPYFKFGTHMIPHPQKAHKGGEDAFFAGANLLAVSDGVGGWNQMGIDPSAFSRALCSNAYTVFARRPKFYSENPQELMAQSVNNNHNLGSATMVIVTLDQKGVVHSANLGDSGYKWLRRASNANFAIMYQSAQQQHGFNFPFQLAAPNANQDNGDSPYQSEIKSHTVENGDLIIVGSDGLFDNVYMQELLFVLKRQGRFNDEGVMQNNDQVAKTLAELGIRYGGDEKYFSPFAARARHEGHPEWTGGKLDDTTVIIAQVMLNQSGNQSRSQL